MYTFRFNPVFERWVLLGRSVVPVEEVKKAHFLGIGTSSDFAAITYPRQPFILEPPERYDKGNKDLLYASAAPVGEYELFLYSGSRDFFSWRKEEWLQWLELLQLRLGQTHHNPHLHFVHCVLHTSARESIEGYQRVGDYIASSHPVTGLSTPLPTDLANKLRSKEALFHVLDDERGRLYVPSAPLQEKEVWYIPREYRRGIEQCDRKELRGLADVLSRLFGSLHEEYPHEAYALNVHTSLSGAAGSKTWWIQIYREPTPVESALPVRPLPELFVHHLKKLLG